MVAGREENGRFQKGVSGNPRGRAPKEREQEYYDILASSVSVEDWRLIVTRAVNDAKRGDTAARKWLSDYLMGLPVQQVDQRNSGDVTFRIVYDQRDKDPSTGAA